MKIRRFLPASLLLLAAWALPAGAARADTLLYDGISVISGSQSQVQSFNVATPGLLTLTLSTIPWLDAVSNLSGFLTSASGMIGNTIGAGSESVNVGAGTYYAHWFGTAQGDYNLGVVGMKITFQPGNITPVPLPVSFVLLLSGLGLLFGWQRRETIPAGREIMSSGGAILAG
jgi:hypothetical protein